MWHKIFTWLHVLNVPCLFAGKADSTVQQNANCQVEAAITQSRRWVRCIPKHRSVAADCRLYRPRAKGLLLTTLLHCAVHCHLTLWTMKIWSDWFVVGSLIIASLWILYVMCPLQNFENWSSVLAAEDVHRRSWTFFLWLLTRMVKTCSLCLTWLVPGCNGQTELHIVAYKNQCLILSVVNVNILPIFVTLCILKCGEVTNWWLIKQSQKWCE